MRKFPDNCHPHNRGLITTSGRAVRMRGDHFIFYVNGTEIDRVDDGEHESGTMGIVNVDSRLDVVYRKGPESPRTHDTGGEFREAG